MLISLMGPTASGKTDLAILLAHELKAEIVNADSMQSYADLHILTARPKDDQTSEIPHHGYGVIGQDQPHASVGHWYAGVQQMIKNKADQNLIFVGGTGLYHHALIHGLADIPDIDPSLNQHLRRLYENMGREGLLKTYPDWAQELKKIPDPQRLLRALAVAIQSGKSLNFWQEQQQPNPVTVPVYGFAIDLDRREIYSRINRRFEAMVEQGALDEVQRLMQLNYDSDHPLLKAIGVQDLRSYIEGRATLCQAITLAQQKTRNYAKRQMTWVRGRMATYHRLTSPHTQENLEFMIKTLKSLPPLSITATQD